MKRIIVFSILILTLAGVGFAQSIEQKIIGTWITNSNEESATWIFRADGIISMIFEEGTEEYKYGIIDTSLAIQPIKGNHQPLILKFSISADGKTLLIDARPRGSEIMFTKKQD